VNTDYCVNRAIETPKLKLTMVSIYCNGKTITVFAQLPILDGKAVASLDLIHAMLSDLGCNGRGVTFSIG